MNNFTHSPKFVWFFAIIGILAVVAIIIVAFLLPKQPRQGSQSKNNQTPIFKPTITAVANDKLPSKFPADIPIEASAKITENYNASTTSGGFQATRVFESTKSPADNLKIFQAYFRTNGYTVQDPIVVQNYTSVLGTKGKTQIKVSMTENASTKTTTVNISLVELH